MAVTVETIGTLAELAKIGLTEAEQARLAQELEQAIEMTDALDTLDATDVLPTERGALGAGGALREDAAIVEFSRAEILANAPERDETAFLTPKVLE